MKRRRKNGKRGQIKWGSPVTLHRWHDVVFMVRKVDRGKIVWEAWAYGYGHLVYAGWFEPVTGKTAVMRARAFIDHHPVAEIQFQAAARGVVAGESHALEFRQDLDERGLVLLDRAISEGWHEQPPDWSRPWIKNGRRR